MSIMNTDEMALRSLQEERTANIRLYQGPHTTKPAKVSIDWDAITPHCKTCGAKTGQLNRDDICRTCSTPPELPQEGKHGQPTTRRSAPRAKKASSKSRRARDAGSSTTQRKNRPAQRETRPAEPGRPGRVPAPLDEAAIVEAYQGGQAITSICAALGTTNRSRVRQILTDRGVQLRTDHVHGGPAGKPVSERAIVDAYKDGATAPELAREYGVGARRIRAILDRYQVERRDDRTLNSGGRPRKYADHVIAEVRRLYVEEQKSRADVAEQLGLPYKTVVTIMRREGVQAREHQSGHADGAVALKDHLRRLGVESREVKAWALGAGLVSKISSGIPAQALVDAYEAANPTSLGHGAAPDVGGRADG